VPDHSIAGPPTAPIFAARGAAGARHTSAGTTVNV
jgi:hypothetical protein